MGTPVIYRGSKDAWLIYSVMSQELKNESIDLDLSNIKFLKTNEIILLVMFMIHLTSNGNIIRVTGPKDQKARGYIHDIMLIDFCNSNWVESTTLNAISSQTAMPIRRLTEDKMPEYINFSEQYFESICEGKDLTMLNLSMAELLNNVYNHSKSKIDAYAFCQFFPGKQQIHVVVGDYGIGIPSSVNKYLIEQEKSISHALSDVDSLAWAVELNNSAKSIPNNQGKGLFNVLNFVKSNKGKVFIYTNGAFLMSDVDTNFESVVEQNYISNFQGTIVVLVIDVNNLEEIDRELVDFDF
ncbi:MAG: hypothetical protein MK105_15710 [Crocinitomicaceae bacterium]|nr:hypothetical protein [Crocinitomicaceae bacterium]